MVECGECQKLNCKACIDKWTRLNKNCPNCRAVYKPSGKPNRFVTNTLSEITFNCAKCSEKFKYGDYNKHLRDCKGK